MAEPALTLKAFLSHRYKSPDVNLFFYRLLSKQAKVQFGIDKGTFATSVTRLERLIRDAHAFIGIYPLPFDRAHHTVRAELLNASRYFRLELDIAIRAHKPSLVFFDERYADVLTVPDVVTAIPFDAQEVSSEGGTPREREFLRRIADFWRVVRAAINLDAQQTAMRRPGRVGLIVPDIEKVSDGYTEGEVGSIRRVVQASEIPSVEGPPGALMLDGRMHRWLESLDWAIVEVGNWMMGTGIVGHLHGRALPTVRLYKGANSVGEVVDQPSYRTLYGGFEVGYPKDIVFWTSTAELEVELKSRLDVVRRDPERIKTTGSAEEYFRAASLRNESVFLSYSGKDQELASQLARELRQRFQTVFDYRDGQSITPGQPWIKEVFDTLARSALGVPLISADYLASGNCTHEAEEMVALQDSGKMVVIPIKLNPDTLRPFSWMTNRQYLRLWEYRDVATAVGMLVQSFDRGLAGKAGSHAS